MKSSPVIAVVGPTSSGKSGLAVWLAQKFNGEIISADSRQVYRGLDIGSGKVPRDPLSKSYNLKAKSYLHQGIPHHLLDVANSKKVFSAAQYQKLANRAIVNIIRHGKTPIICGGAGFYIDTLRGKIALPPTPPNPKLRAKLEKLSTEKLGDKLRTLDPKRFGNIDLKNRPRLIRAIEITTTLGRSKTFSCQGRTLTCDWLMIGIKLDSEKLKKKINARLKFRINHGLIDEVRKLHKNGLSWRRLDALGLEYRYVTRYLRGLISKKELTKELETAIWHYAKRQMTWFKRDQTIHWTKNYREAEKLTVAFLKKSGKIIK